MPRYLLTDQVSDKINELNHTIQHSSLWHNQPLRLAVLSQAIPQKLIELLGLEAILQRVPDSYVQAVFGSYLASRYVYKVGLADNAMSFYEFMQPFLAEAIHREAAKDGKEEKGKKGASRRALPAVAQAGSSGESVKASMHAKGQQQ